MQFETLLLTKKVLSW